MEYYYAEISRDFISNRRITNGHRSILHFHNVWEIYLFNRGKGIFNFENFSFELKHGDLVIIPPNCLHGANCSEECEYDRIDINIKEEYIRNLSSENTNLMECFKNENDCSKYIARLNEEQINEIVTLQHNLDERFQENLFGSDLIYHANIITLLVAINRAMKGEVSSADNIMPQMIWEISNFVSENIQSDISSKNIAENLHMNSDYINRRFKSYTGISIRQYILKKRITNACDLLKQGMNVTEACYGSGFKDYTNFIRTFKNTVGVSPGKYMKEKNI